jgi:GrpB-like predicted nucleotidyltransferase (UPF0157 family)
MAVDVVEYSPTWPELFAAVAADLSRALEGVPIQAIEHVGSTAVPGLAAKPVLDIDVVVDADDIASAIRALATIGYTHTGDLGLSGREALSAPDDDPRRHVYVCVSGSLHLRNHLSVRDVLRRRPDLRERYGAVKLALARDPYIDMTEYVAGKSDVLQAVLEQSDLTDSERSAIRTMNSAN